MAQDPEKEWICTIEEIQEIERIKFGRLLTTEEKRLISEAWCSALQAQMAWEAVKEAFGATERARALVVRPKMSRRRLGSAKNPHRRG
jgi:hypothetical protein